MRSDDSNEAYACVVVRLKGAHNGLWKPANPVKEISFVELLLRTVARIAAVSGVVALLVWLTWVMLDVKNLQSGFTLP